jgi:putative endonuclease
MFYVYILFSDDYRRTYVGQTDDRERRLKEHNAGKVRSTKPNRPWNMIYSEACASKEKTLKREKWFKSTSGRKKIAQILKELGLNS